MTLNEKIESNVIILPNEVDIKDLLELRLPNPKTGFEIYYWDNIKKRMLHRSRVNFNKAKTWITNNRIHKDGSYYIITEVDVIFVLLYIMEKCGTSQSFIEVDTIHMNNNYQKEGVSGSIKFLLSQDDILNNSIIKICDIKEFGTTKLVSLNTNKVLEYFQKKVEHCKMEYKQIRGLMEVSQVEEAKVELDPPLVEDIRVVEIFGIMCNYLSPVWVDKLSTHLRISEAKIRIDSTQEIANELSSISVRDYMKPKLTEVEAKPVKVKTVPKAPKGSQSITNFFKKSK
ncbi:hypothetical protein BB559_001532 [Furculomyces boomerangus]|uniref:Ribonuclease H2 subunit B wHTH domain-containing protein n=1 Tax=Furculomyces boomerangus TaxID=61424 RepID=A0A2T9YCT4_9FUNG|nr:hypothetical protein BB559_004766 [Furculomyces boomerangus]PVU98489.1 hypothetical protein BB559_001532 [Furculomyces boomerangus]